MIGIDEIVASLSVASAAVAAVAISILALDLRSRLRGVEGQLYTVSAPATRVPAQQFFMSLHGLLRPPLQRLLAGQPWVSLELVGRGGQIGVQVWIPAGQRPFIESLLRAAYPGVILTFVPEPRTGGSPCAAAWAQLARGNDLAIRTTFPGESLANVLWTLARVPAGATVTVQLLVRPRPDGWQRKVHGRAQGLRDHRRVETSLFHETRILRPSQADKERGAAMETKAEGVGFDCVLRVCAAAAHGKTARELVRAVGAGLGVFAGENAIRLRSVYLFVDHFERAVRLRRFPLRGSLLLTVPELAALWHLPSEAPPQLEVVRSPQLPPPRGAERGERVLGVSTWAGADREVGLSVPDSRYHLHLLGSTGTGKTTALLNLACRDIAAGRGVGVLDPKGDLVRGLLERIPRERIGDVVLVSPDDTATSVGINPLECWPGDDRDLVADNALVIFKRIYERYWGPRTDDILKSALLTLLRSPGTTLGHVPTLLSDPSFRARTLTTLHDPLGLDGFWKWFDALSESQQAEATGPVLNKLRDFLLRPKLRRLLCQSRSTVDLRAVVDSGKILLADLSVGRWGDTTSSLIGSFLVARIWQAVLARSVTNEERRRDFFLFVDEFQHFVGIAGPFADVLAEARSLHLALTVANQHLGQLTRDLREAVASNARSRIVFQCGQDDASYLAREFAPLDAQALMSLGRFEAAARLSIGGRSSEPFSLRTLPQSEGADPDLAAAARAASAVRFGRPVEQVDTDLQMVIPNHGEPPGVTGARLRRRRGVDDPADAR